MDLDIEIDEGKLKECSEKLQTYYNFLFAIGAIESCLKGYFSYIIYCYYDQGRKSAISSQRAENGVPVHEGSTISEMS